MRGKTVYLRLFEPEDYEKTYVWHNDFDLQKTTCGPLRFVSKEIEKNWVLSKATHNQSDIYLAICLIENDEMIGWYSINNIDYHNRKCHCGGVVIGDKKYRDSVAYDEAGRLAFDYIINELNMNRISGSCLKEHIITCAQFEAGYWQLEGVERESVFKGGRYHDVCRYAILRKDYLCHLANGDYNNLEKRMAVIVKRLRQELKKS